MWGQNEVNDAGRCEGGAGRAATGVSTNWPRSARLSTCEKQKTGPVELVRSLIKQRSRLRSDFQFRGWNSAMVHWENGPRSVPGVVASTPEKLDRFCTVSAPVFKTAVVHFSKAATPNGREDRRRSEIGNRPHRQFLVTASIHDAKLAPPKPVQKRRSFGFRQNCGREATGSSMELNCHSLIRLSHRERFRIMFGPAALHRHEPARAIVRSPATG